METVLSADGTRVAFDRVGAGPHLVLVHGTGRDRGYWSRCLPSLARRATVYTIDRRGRGGSGDADDYAIEREVEDVLAVMDAVPEPAHLLGHSYGAIVTLEAALRSTSLASLILYEPPIGVGADRVPDDLGDRLAALGAAGGREAVLETFLREGPRYPPEVIAKQRARADWSNRLAYAHTLAREAQAVPRHMFDRARVTEATKIVTELANGRDGYVSALRERDVRFSAIRRQAERLVVDPIST